MPTGRDAQKSDRIVEEVVRDREKAEKLKEERHRDPGDGPAAEPEDVGMEGEEEDGADLWDNVPV